MRTEHDVIVGDSRELTEIDTGSVELVVTSPPYPMIEMWDEVFGELNPTVESRLEAGKGDAAFQLMHEELDRTWEEINRVLVDGGIACINVGDATRKLDGSFRVYQNHARIIEAFDRLGFVPLPDILWRKPVNSAAKFMGSGMLPPNAYATLEHEYILVFRNGESLRSFDANAERRYEAAYFWEERNAWFSDVWTDVQGVAQELAPVSMRDRSGAYPLEIPYRLVNMFSVYGDTVLDPFWGTGTTTIASMVAGRDSIGYELSNEFVNEFSVRLESIEELSQEIIEERVDRHVEFVTEQEAAGEEVSYAAEQYSFSVMTKQEQHIRFFVVDEVSEVDGEYVVRHQPYEQA